MNITPTLPSLPDVPAQQPQRTVGSVQATARSRDATDEPERRPPARHTIDESRRARLVARAETLATRQGEHSAHANRALASYARVAADADRDSLQDLLGFDEYA